MAWQELTYRLKSTCPLITHNGQGVNPRNRFTIALKLISGKTKKTDADYEEMAWIEFQSALYMGPDGPIIPADVLVAMLIAAAKKFKEGQLARAGMFVKGDALLVYSGSKNVREMFEDDNIRDTRPVALSGKRIMRTRPRFNSWELTFTVCFEDTVIANGSRIDEWVRTGGTIIGLCEMRPRLGRFEIIA